MAREKRITVGLNNIENEKLTKIAEFYQVNKSEALRVIIQNEYQSLKNTNLVE